MRLKKQEEIVSLMRLIDNFNGSLVIRKNMVYFGDKLIATFEGNKAKMIHYDKETDERAKGTTIL